MNHLEKLLFQYYDWHGYLVKRNIKVGPLGHGGWECELDIVAYDPQKKHLVHIEPSLDADSWGKREIRFKKKFAAGAKYIYKDVFPWLDASTPIEQVAVLISHPSNHETLAGGKVVSVDELVAGIVKEVREEGIMSKCAIPEQFDILRTIQLTECGYFGLK